MFRIVGALLIMIGCSGLGLAYKEELSEGIKALRVLRNLFEMMMSEISYRRSTLPECCRQVAGNMEEPYRSSLFALYESVGVKKEVDFSSGWHREMSKCMISIPLTTKEKEMVLGFVSSEGLSDVQMQIRAIEQYRDMIDGNIKKRESEFSKQGRMMTGLGVMSGLLLIVILL